MSEQAEKPVYPDTQDIDEQRRAFVLDCLTQSGDAAAIDGRILSENLAILAEWLKSGSIPDRREVEKRYRPKSAVVPP